MARTNTLEPFLIRKEVYPVAAVAVAPDATVALATAAPLSYNPEWTLTEIKAVWFFSGVIIDAGAGSVPAVRVVSDPSGAANIVGSLSFPGSLAAGVSALFPYIGRGEAPNSPAMDNGQVLELQGQNPGGAGNVTFDGFFTLEVFAQQAP